MNTTPNGSGPTGTERRFSWPAWEKHLTALLVALVALIGLRIFSTTEDTADQVIALSEKVVGMQRNIDDWRDDIRARFDQQFRDYDRRILDNKARIERLESKEAK